MRPARYRLITRSDFDGLVCAVLLRELDLIDDILFVHPKDMQDGKVQVTGSLGDGDSLKSVIHNKDWNEIHIVAKGNHMQHFVNGIPMADFTDEDTAHRKMSGIIALQVHVMPSMKVEYRNIRIKQ